MNHSFESYTSVFTNCSSQYSDLSFEEIVESNPANFQTSTMELETLIPLKQLNQAINALNKNDNDDLEIKIEVGQNILSVTDYFELNQISCNLGNNDMLKMILSKYQQDPHCLSFIATPKEDDSQVSFVGDAPNDTKMTDKEMNYLQSQKYILKKYLECVTGIKSLSLYYMHSPGTFLQDLSEYFTENAKLLYCDLKEHLLDQFVGMYKFYKNAHELLPCIFEIIIQILDFYGESIEFKCYETIHTLKNTYNIKISRSIHNKCSYLYNTIYKCNIKRNLRKYISTDESEVNNQQEESGEKDSTSEKDEELVSKSNLDEDIDPIITNDNKRDSLDSISDSEDSFTASSNNLMSSMNASEINLVKIINLNFLAFILRHNKSLNKVILDKHDKILANILQKDKIVMSKYYYVFNTTMFSLNTKVRDSKVVSDKDKNTLSMLCEYNFQTEQQWDLVVQYYITICKFGKDLNLKQNEAINTDESDISTISSYFMNKIIGKLYSAFESNVYYKLAEILASRIDSIFEVFTGKNMELFYTCILMIIKSSQPSIIEVLFGQLYKIAELIDYKTYLEMVEKKLNVLNCPNNKSNSEQEQEEIENEEQELFYDHLLNLIKISNSQSLSVKILRFQLKLLTRDPALIKERIGYIANYFEMSDYLSEYIIIIDILLQANMCDSNLVKAVMIVLQDTDNFHHVLQFLKLFKDSVYIKESRVEIPFIIHMCEKCLESSFKWIVQRECLNVLYLVWKHNENYRKSVPCILHKLVGDRRYNKRSIITDYYIMIMIHIEKEETQFEFIDAFYNTYLQYESLDINKEYAIFRLEKLITYMTSIDHDKDEYEIYAERIKQYKEMLEE